MQRSNLRDVGDSRQASIQAYPLNELLANPHLIALPEPVIAPIAYAGRVTVLSAREKLGKSTLLGQVVADLSTGTSFFEHGRGIAPQRVLWFAIDEPLGDAVRRLQGYSAAPPEVYLCDQRPTAPDVARLVRDVGAGLVVVDTLSELWATELEHERDANSVARFLRPFVDVARGTNVAVLMAYHTRKCGDEYRGSVALGATVDAALTLRATAAPAAAGADERDVGACELGGRVIVGQARWGRVHVRLAFDGQRYSMCGERVVPTVPLRERALEAIRTRAARSADTLATHLKVRRSIAGAMVTELMDVGLVRREGRFLVVVVDGTTTTP